MRVELGATRTARFHAEQSLRDMAQDLADVMRQRDEAITRMRLAEAQLEALAFTPEAVWRQRYLREVETNTRLDERLARAEGRPRGLVLPDDGPMVTALLGGQG